MKYLTIVLLTILTCANSSPVDRASTCDRHACPKGTHCTLAKVQCAQEPCPAVPQCLSSLPNLNTHDVCNDHKCGEGKRCVPWSLCQFDPTCNIIPRCVRVG
ncbi:hypothetical protein QR680_006290 [Steinernema hermaphroditum]|uniref:Follistatin-like domain-containing protein n=1 Tax=Steinernema hermaphroditum TaxID=289476 RepID=A0AA39HWC3_9BILA|nr:hypothetical protein QR680_006290 [Steinernema hermaphroditum]